MNIIREAKNSDIKQIMKIMRSQINSIILEKVIYGSKGIDKYLYENLNRKGIDKEKVNIVYEINGQVVGYIELLLESENLFISYIVIDREYTQRGIGKELITAAIYKCYLKRKFKYIFIDVFDKNIIAKELYKKIGFKEISKVSWIEINIKKCTDTDCKNEFKIINYNEVKKQHDELGFAIYLICDNQKSYKIGFINDILKIYDYSILNNEGLVSFIQKEFKYKKVWGAFNNYYEKYDDNFIDNLIRMRINYDAYLEYNFV